jgi:uncharacterized protein DUF3551
MRKLPIMAGLALLGATLSGQAQAYVNYPWCYVGDNRGMDCVFSTRDQCAQDGRNRGFGGQCMKNPNYNPGLPSVISEGRQFQESDHQGRRQLGGRF